MCRSDPLIFLGGPVTVGLPEYEEYDIMYNDMGYLFHFQEIRK